MSEDKDIKQEKYMSEWINCSMTGDITELEELKKRIGCPDIIKWIQNEMEELKKRKNVIKLGSINPATFEILTKKGWVPLKEENKEE